MSALIVVALLLVLITIILLLCFRRTPEMFHAEPASLADAAVYAIHMQRMTMRETRLREMLRTYFPNNPTRIVEPVSLETIHDSFAEYLHQGILHGEAARHLLGSSKPSSERGRLSLPALSLSLTNLTILRREVPMHRPVLILEDDVTCDLSPEVFSSTAASAFRSIGPDWDIVYLSCHLQRADLENDRNRMPNTDGVLRLRTRVHQMGAVLYHPRVIPLLLDTLVPLQQQIDHDIPDRLVVPGKVRAFVVLHPVRRDRSILFADNLAYGSSTQVS